MSDTVKLVIEIPEEIYARCKEFKLWSYDAETLEGAVATSTPLSEGEYIKKEDGQAKIKLICDKFGYLYDESGEFEWGKSSKAWGHALDSLPTYSFPDLSEVLAENKSEWIPVSERLPEKNVWVLVTVEQSGKCFQEIMRRSNYFEAWTDDIDYYTDEIIAWKPLPEPYKAESEEGSAE